MLLLGRETGSFNKFRDIITEICTEDRNMKFNIYFVIKCKGKCETIHVALPSISQTLTQEISPNLGLILGLRTR